MGACRISGSLVLGVDVSADEKEQGKRRVSRVCFLFCGDLFAPKNTRRRAALHFNFYSRHARTTFAPDCH